MGSEMCIRDRTWTDPSSGRTVEVEVAHHPAHGRTARRLAAAARAALGSYAARFGPYPHHQLRLVEAPGDGVSLRAYPTLIRYSEGFARLDAEADGRGIDLPFAVVAHEVAHQWWGSGLVPAHAEGAPVLTETLAWYSALGVVEEALGPAHLDRLTALLREAYLAPRPEAGPPLLRATDPFDTYRRGPFAMVALQHAVGADRVDAALRELYATYGAGGPPLPTSIDLYQKLRAVTPDSLRPLLADLFERNTRWDLETQRVRAEPAGRGAWRVRLDVRAEKTVVDEGGTATEVPMDEPVEVGVYAEPGGGGAPLYLRPHRLRGGDQTITVTVPRRPASAGLDPRHLYVDGAPFDNVADLPTRL